MKRFVRVRMLYLKEKLNEKSFLKGKKCIAKKA